MSKIEHDGTFSTYDHETVYELRRLEGDPADPSARRRACRVHTPRFHRGPDQVSSFLDTLDRALDEGQDVVIPHAELRDLIDSIDPRRALGKVPPRY